MKTISADFFDMSAKYSLLSQTHEDNQSKGFSGDEDQLRLARPRRNLNLLWVLHIALLSLSGVILFQAWTLRQSDEHCMAATSMWSPALSAFKGKTKEVRFMGTLAGYSPFKGPPNEDVEAAWNEVVELPAVRIDRATLERIKAPNIDSAIKLPDEVGGGYYAATEGQHQLHCLYMLWQHSHIDYYKSRSLTWTDSPERIRQHLDHCADLLRQKLMCEADAGLVTYNWIANYSRPFPNFNVMHKCRANWDDLTQWNMENAVRLPAGKFAPDKDAVILDYEP